MRAGAGLSLRHLDEAVPEPSEPSSPGHRSESQKSVSADPLIRRNGLWQSEAQRTSGRRAKRADSAILRLPDFPLRRVRSGAGAAGEAFVAGAGLRTFDRHVSLAVSVNSLTSLGSSRRTKGAAVTRSTSISESGFSAGLAVTDGCLMPVTRPAGVQ